VTPCGAIRKLRTRIIPFIFVLMVAFPDRIHIGFAALTSSELAITNQQPTHPRF
jgi:hypothetical protein